MWKKPCSGCLQELKNFGRDLLAMPKCVCGCFWEWSLMRAFKYEVFHNVGLTAKSGLKESFDCTIFSVWIIIVLAVK